MKKRTQIYVLFLTFVFCTSCNAQNKTELPKDNIKPETKDVITYNSPSTISRNIIQDRKGNIWIAAFDGVFRYDGKSFINMTSEVTSARFFSVLEDRKGNLWFGSIGSGVYYYDGKSFQNFTTKEGLLNNEIVCIYEDKIGTIWFGANGGVSRYDGKSFRNYLMNGDSFMEDRTGISISNQRPMNEINSIIEDKTGKFWFGTRGNTFVYDGKTFTTLTHNGTPFGNVRSIIEDTKGTIWLGGSSGLWRYDGSIFTNFTQNFVGYIYEDKNGNIWTSSQIAKDGRWTLSRYDEKSLSTSLYINSPFIKPTVTEIKSKYEDNKGMIFGILEASDETIWFGALDGVHRYDGKTITHFKSKESRK